MIATKRASEFPDARTPQIAAWLDFVRVFA
jgi:hypothetical protein